MDRDSWGDNCNFEQDDIESEILELDLAPSGGADDDEVRLSDSTFSTVIKCYSGLGSCYSS